MLFLLDTGVKASLIIFFYLLLSLLFNFVGWEGV